MVVWWKEEEFGGSGDAEIKEVGYVGEKDYDATRDSNVDETDTGLFFGRGGEEKGEESIGEVEMFEGWDVTSAARGRTFFVTGYV